MRRWRSWKRRQPRVTVAGVREAQQEVMEERERQRMEEKEKAAWIMEETKPLPTWKIGGEGVRAWNRI